MSDKDTLLPPDRSEENLDPEDWEATRALGHRMLDDMMDYMKTVADRPAATLFNRTSGVCPTVSTMLL